MLQKKDKKRYESDNIKKPQCVKREILIVCEGKDEREFLNHHKNKYNEHLQNKLIWIIDTKNKYESDIQNLVERKLSDDPYGENIRYASVFFIFDRDVSVDKTKKLRIERANSLINKYNKLRRKNSNQPKAFRICTNPCFEFWLLLNFIEPEARKNHCTKTIIVKDLNKILKTRTYSIGDNLSKEQKQENKTIWQSIDFFNVVNKAKRLYNRVLNMNYDNNHWLTEECNYSEIFQLIKSETI